MVAQVSPFTPGKKSTSALDASLTAIRDDVLSSVRAEHEQALNAMQRTIDQLTTQVKDLVGRKIEVAPAPAPQVTVSPQIDVKVPDQLPPDVEVVVDLSTLNKSIADLRADLKRPVIRTVERDSDGLITSVTERWA